MLFAFSLLPRSETWPQSFVSFCSILNLPMHVFVCITWPICYSFLVFSNAISIWNRFIFLAAFVPTLHTDAVWYLVGDVGRLLQANSASSHPECLVPSPDADTLTGRDGEERVCHCYGVPMHLSPLSHALWLRWLYAGHYWVITIVFELCWGCVVFMWWSRTVGDWAFAAASPTLWNSLPHDITDCVPLTSFCRKLKTFFVFFIISMTTFFSGPWGFYLGHFKNFLCMYVCMYDCGGWPTGRLQCFDTVGWVIWPVKNYPWNYL